MTDDRIFEALEDLLRDRRARHQRGLQRPGAAHLPRRARAWTPTSTGSTQAGVATGASLHVNGIDPGFANDVLPLAMTSLSQRIDLVRVSEIADYSTYYQPVVMRDIYGFGSRWSRWRCSGSRAS